MRLLYVLLFLTNKVSQYFYKLYKCFPNAISTDILCKDEVWPTHFIIECTAVAV